MRARNHAEKCSLARAVGAKEAADLLFRDVEADGRCAPVITLKSVVLPAPLGPMKPQICFSGMSKLTSLSAATPPKYFVSFSTSRILTFTPSSCVAGKLGFGLLERQEPEEPPQESKQAIRLKQDDDNQ